MNNFYKSLRKGHFNRKIGKRFESQYTKEDIQHPIDIKILNLIGYQGIAN